jgi:hypothetical protein
VNAGHAHRRPNLRHPRELRRELANPSMQRMLARPFRLVLTKDVPDLAGYSVAEPLNVYVDQDFMAALHAGQVVVPRMAPHQIVQCLVRHEWVEKGLLDADNDINWYQDAHEFATLAEHEAVRATGARPADYERALRSLIKVVAVKPIVSPPPDLDCEPYVDHPDANDRRVLRAFQRLGVADAHKTPKEKLRYGPSTGRDRCSGCANWLADAPVELSPCAVVSGAVRDSYWCQRFEAAQRQEHANGQAHHQSPQSASDQRIRRAG